MAVWSTAYKKSLPDSAFLLVAGRGKDRVRKLPWKDRQGRPNYRHLVNAISRAPQVKDLPAAKARKIQDRARCLLERHFPAGRAVPRSCKLRSDDALMKEEHALKQRLKEVRAERRERAA